VVGTGGADVLVGSIGHDILDGMGGNDTLTGGDGRDVFSLSRGSGYDVITDFVGGTGAGDGTGPGAGDVIELRGSLTSFSQLIANAFQQENGVHIMLGSDELLLAGLRIENLAADDFVFFP
jgi:Ca2+-binding RTX toxin-like protein